MITDRHGKAQVYCYRGRQAKSCNQPPVMLGAVEEQLAAYLASFHVARGDGGVGSGCMSGRRTSATAPNVGGARLGGRSNASLSCTRGGPDA